MNLDRERTLWTQGQLALVDIQERVESCKNWMGLVVGFWTDWGYFNDVLTAVLGGNATNSITVIDPQPAALEAPAGGFDAPDLDVNAFYDLRRDSEGIP
jgi:hypothetical protein